MSTTAAQLYKQDFVRWAESQAEALRDASRSGANLPLDWDNLIEEVESLGRSERRELGSRLATVIEHLLKLDFSPAADPRPGWIRTVLRERSEIARLLEGSPSLKPEVASMVEVEKRRATKLAVKEIVTFVEENAALFAKLAGARYDTDQVLGD